ncbi:MAG: transposase [Anaerolineae bacterium]|nr:transposase [Anaerolineae bacterium]
METVTQIQVAWELKKAGHRADEIAEQLGRHRATVYRWLKGIRQRGIRGYIAYFKQCKQGHRQRKTHGAVVARVLRLRREFRNCCGEKLVYLLSLEGIKLSLSTVYRILKRHLVLGKKRPPFKGEPLQQASKPRQVVQVDTLNLGELYAYTAIDTFTREAVIVMRPSLQACDGKVALAQIGDRMGQIALLQTDGGSEFKAECAQSLHHLCQQHRVARPYKKNEQAFIEAFNGTLRREEFGHTPFTVADLALAQQRADAFLDYYHRQRPHLSLGMLTPSQFANAIAESHLT